VERQGRKNAGVRVMLTGKGVNAVGSKWGERHIGMMSDLDVSLGSEDRNAVSFEEAHSPESI